MLVVGIPVIDGHELTRKCVWNLAVTVLEPSSVGILIIDQASDEPFTVEEFAPYTDVLKISVLRLSKNVGYYRALIHAASFCHTSADLVALMHNDLFIYEPGWDIRVRDEFVGKSDLGMIGFFGSNEVDDRGGRGGGSMCYFDGTEGQSQAAGKLIKDLQPALVLDSLFMATRRSLIPLLRIDEHTPICHFMDKVWPLRLVDAGWKVGALGIRVDHLGGMTATTPRFEAEAKQWCIDEGLTQVSNAEATATEPGGLMLYLEAERRFLTEMRAKRLVPSHMQGWEVVRG